MTPEAKAEKIAAIAHALARRQRCHVSHSGHTVRRVLLAVGALLGKPVTFADGQMIRGEDDK